MDLSSAGGARLADYANVPRLIGAVVSTGKATLHELDTVYSIEDCFDLLEISAIDSHNRRILNKRPRE